MVLAVRSGLRGAEPLKACARRSRRRFGDKMTLRPRGRRGSETSIGEDVPERSADAHRWEVWIQRVAVLVTGWFVAFQPISADDWWWQLSRGRAVLQGTWSPSAKLLTSENGWEADWLGGLPAYVLYESFGASGWMLCRLAVVGGLLWLAVDSLRSRRLVGFPAMLLTTATLIAVAGYLDPVPRTFGMLGMLFVVWWSWPTFNSSRVPDLAGRHRTSWRSLVAVATVFWLWASTSPSVALGGLLMLIAALHETLAGSRGARARWIEGVVAIVAASLTPRGPLTWSDSLAWLLPASRTSPAALEGTPWAPLHRTDWELDSWLFLGLTVLWIVNRWLLRRRSSAAGKGQVATAGADSSPPATASGVAPGWRQAGLELLELLPFVAVQLVAWSSLHNVPIVIVWLAADIGFQWRTAGLWLKEDSAKTGSEDASGERARGGSAVRMLESVSAAQKHFAVSPSVLGGVLLIALIAVLLKISELPRSMGWGISATLDNRLLLAALEDTRPYGTALADDTRSAGMLIWILPQLPFDGDSVDRPPLRLQDIACRAVPTGRWERQRQLLEDLRRGRLMRYWRDDGTPGGYWLELDKRDTTLLCISNSNVDLIEGLEPSIWKPLSLDSPVIPYAAAGDEAYVRRLIEILQQREIVEYQNWHYQLPGSVGSAFDRDFFGVWPDTADADQVARQADVLRAMDLHYAALRVLSVGRRAFPASPAIADVLRRCQGELAEKEYEDAGRASWLRHWASRYNTERGGLPEFAPPPQRGVLRGGESQDAGPESPGPENAAAIRVLGQRVEAYWRDGPTALLAGGESETHPQLLYAQLCGAIEAGLYEHADQLIATLRQQPIEPSLAALVQRRHRELHPPADG